MQAFSLNNKVALITGGSRGLGREMAIAYARAGARTVITAAAAMDETRDAINAELAGVVHEMKAAGGNGLAVYADVTQWGDCIGAVRQAVDAFGALHVLVNNAARSQRYHGARGIPFWETDPQGWLGVIATNVVGPYYMAKAAAPPLLRAGWGRIINISKHPDQMHEAYAGAYGPSKAALEAEISELGRGTSSAQRDSEYRRPRWRRQHAFRPRAHAQRRARSLRHRPGCAVARIRGIQRHHGKSVRRKALGRLLTNGGSGGAVS